MTPKLNISNSAEVHFTSTDKKLVYEDRANKNNVTKICDNAKHRSAPYLSRENVIITEDQR